MRKWIVLALLSSTVSANALVLPQLFFPTFPTHQEDFNAIPPGSYFASMLFSAPVTSTIYGLPPGGGSLDIGPPPFWMPPAFSPPHTLYANGMNVGIRFVPPQRRFGGYFRSTPNSAGIGASFLKFAFFDASGTFIGSQGAPVGTPWTWIGYRTVPQKFSRIEIYSNVGGGFEMDDLRIRPF